MFIWRDDSGKPVSYTGSFNKEQWDAAVEEYAQKEAAEQAPSPEPKPRARKTAATKED